MLAPELAQVSYKSFAVLTAALASFFYFRFENNQLSDTPRTVALLIVLGTAVRFMIAWQGYGNYDGHSWEIAADAAAAGRNVYLDTTRYQYTPIWFWILGFLKAIACPVRVFLTGVDLATLGVLCAIGRRQKISALQVTLFFYLNPVSFLLTGYHGQFENLALLFLLLGVWGEGRKGWPWLFSTLGMLVKHSLFPQTLAVLRHSAKDLRKVAAFFAVSCAVFFALFLPYWGQAKEDIIRNVFLYSSYPLDYGVRTFFEVEWLKWAFVAGLFIYPLALRTADLVQRLLLCALFFLVFTTGFGNQYLILPIALAALRPSKGFFLYTALTTLFLLGDQKNLGIQVFSWMPLNAVWFAAAYWFLLIHSKTAESASFTSFNIHSLEK